MTIDEAYKKIINRKERRIRSSERVISRYKDNIEKMEEEIEMLGESRNEIEIFHKRMQLLRGYSDWEIRLKNLPRMAEHSLLFDGIRHERLLENAGDLGRKTEELLWHSFDMCLRDDRDRHAHLMKTYFVPASKVKEYTIKDFEALVISRSMNEGQYNFFMAMSVEHIHDAMLESIERNLILIEGEINQQKNGAITVRKSYIETIFPTLLENILKFRIPVVNNEDTLKRYEKGYKSRGKITQYRIIEAAA